MNGLKGFFNKNEYGWRLLVLVVCLLAVFLLVLAVLNFKGILVFLGKIVTSLWKSMGPLIVGIILAYLLDPLVNFLSAKLHATRLIAVILSYFIVIIVLGALIYGFISLMLGYIPTGGLGELTDKVWQYIYSYRETIAKFMHGMPDIFTSGTSDYFSGLVVNWLSRNLEGDGLFTAIKAISTFMINLGIGIIISVYIQLDKDLFLRWLRSFCHLTMSQRNHGIFAELSYEINRIFSTYIRGTLLDSIIIASLSSVILFVIGVAYAPFLGVIIGLFNIIPYFGPFLGMIPVVIVSLTTSDLNQAVWSVLLLFALQQVDSNYIYPKVVGQSTGLHPLVILVAVSILGYFYGIAGMLLAVPTAGILQLFVLRWAEKR